MDTREMLTHIASVLKTALDKGGKGEFTVSVRVDPTKNPTRFADDDVFVGRTAGKEEEKSTLSFIISNPDGEIIDHTDYIRETMAKTLGPLAAYVDFTPPPKPEPKKDHLKHLGEKFNAVIATAFAAGISGSHKPYSDWFKERANLEALRETASEPVHTTHGHAVRTAHTDTSINVSIGLSGGVNAADVQKAFEARKTGILTLLGRMVAKKLKKAKGSAEEVTIIEKVKTFDMAVTTINWGGSSSDINIEFRSPEVMNALQEKGGLAALSGDKLKELKDSNPLLKLNDGDGLPGNPAELKKAFARAIFYEGEKGEIPIELFAKLAGPLDERVGIEKTLKYISEKASTLGEKAPTLKKDIDAILTDPLFKERSNWICEGSNKTEGDKPKVFPHKTELDPSYVPGQYRVDFKIPGDEKKRIELLNQLAALNTPAPAQTVQPAPAGQPAAVTPPGQPTEDEAIAQAVMAQMAAQSQPSNAIGGNILTAGPQSYSATATWGEQVGGPKPPVAQPQPQADGNWIDRTVQSTKEAIAGIPRALGF